MNENLKNFFRREEAGGSVLMVATVLALIIANSPWAELYNYILTDRHLAHWINDGLMTIFFLVVGLEIKREIKEGALSSVRSALTPFLAAVGGVAVPAIIFYLININHPENMRGWAIPTATDIAFSLGVLALIGSRAPLSLKILLTAIAIIDDLAAILIIAVFYTDMINLVMLGIAGGAVAVMVGLNAINVRNIWYYLVLGFVTWLALLNSGVNPTMAGVATAFCIPIFKNENSTQSWSGQLIDRLHPYTAFFILPLFAFANAGIPLGGVSAETLRSPLLLGITGGLVLGKVLGITTMLVILKPDGLKFRHKLGLGFLCGIGFTMSLFIGELAFAGTGAQVDIRLGVLIASLLSALLAFVTLKSSRD